MQNQRLGTVPILQARGDVFVRTETEQPWRGARNMWTGIAWVLCSCLGFLFLHFSQTACFGGSVEFVYDQVDRLIHVTQSDGTTVDYVYDALGNRLIKTTTLPGAPSNQPPAAVTNPSIPNGLTNVPTTRTPSVGPRRWTRTAATPWSISSTSARRPRRRWSSAAGRRTGRRASCAAGQPTTGRSWRATATTPRPPARSGVSPPATNRLPRTLSPPPPADGRLWP